MQITKSWVLSPMSCLGKIFRGFIGDEYIFHVGEIVNKGGWRADCGRAVVLITSFNGFPVSCLVLSNCIVPSLRVSELGLLSCFVQ